MILRALHAESLKLKRTIALKMVLLAPAAVLGLTIFLASQAPFSMARRGGSVDEWIGMAHLNYFFWGMLMLPLFLTLQTALIAALDHAGDHWKLLFARAIPRWSIYFAKLGIVAAMIAVSSALLYGGILLSGRLLPWLTSELTFSAPAPAARLASECARMAAFSLLALSIQFWISMRWRSFPVAVGSGIVALVVAYTMVIATHQYGGWPQYFPWSLPMLVLAKQPPDMPSTLAVTTALAVAASLLGCWDVCRREVR